MVTVRRADTDDTPLLVALMAEFYAESEFSLDRQWASDSFSALLGDDAKGAVWIAFQDGEPAGYVVLTLRHSMEYGGPDAFIDDLYVRPAHRRQGLGREALSALFAECARRGVLAVHVEAGRSNAAAQALYRSFGLDVFDAARQLLTVRLQGREQGHLSS
ncbi:MAG: GNAT family N-acetyltransferase [Methyloceanibacter sp.]